jgi:antitoxin component YwqK of YwqJK toxin-antitoxin module
MAMAISVYQGRGVSKWLLFILLAGGCRDRVAMQYYNAAETDIIAKRGITMNGTTPVTGIVFLLDDKGDTVHVTSYVKGKQHGAERHYHLNGQLKSVRYYVNGWKQSVHQGWYNTGAPEFVYHYRDDMFEGNQKEWMPSGQLYSDLNYERGQESGSQRVWYASGKIKTNYIIKNNRRYGLLGTKNCINTVDSVFTSR